MHEQKVKMHAKAINMRAKIKQTKIINQTMKQAKLSLTRQDVP
jgi:hypothetical protein